MQCSKCKREFVDDEEVMCEGKGRYSVIKDAVLVTDEAAVFCIPCDEESYKEETAGREEAQPNPGSVADGSGPALASTPEEMGAGDVEPRDESNPGREETKLTGDAQVDEGGGLDSVDMGVDPYKL